MAKVWLMTPALDRILDDPSTPFWASQLVRTLLDKDPIDAASTLEVVAEAFDERARLMLNQPTRADEVNRARLEVLREVEDMLSGSHITGVSVPDVLEDLRKKYGAPAAPEPRCGVCGKSDHTL